MWGWRGAIDGCCAAASAFLFDPPSGKRSGEGSLPRRPPLWSWPPSRRHEGRLHPPSASVVGPSRGRRISFVVGALSSCLLLSVSLRLLWLLCLQDPRMLEDRFSQTRVRAPQVKQHCYLSFSRCTQHVNLLIHVLLCDPPCLNKQRVTDCSSTASRRPQNSEADASRVA